MNKPAEAYVESQVSASPGRERGGIQSLERAFGILEEVARWNEGISLAELSKRVGLHNSTAFHLIKTMVALGYVEQVEDTKRYRIGTRLFVLASGAVNDVELTTVATPFLARLTEKTGETSHFAVRSGSDIYVLARMAGASLFQMTDRIGSVRPAHATAIGKVLLAAIPKEHLASVVGQLKLDAYTEKTIVERERLLREIDIVSEKAVAFDDGEFDTEVRCVATPVRDFTNQVVGAIGISGPIWRLTLQALEEKAGYVRLVAAEMSRELGHRAKD